MNIKKTFIATTIILGMATSIAIAGGLGQKGDKKNGPPPAGQEKLQQDGKPNANTDNNNAGNSGGGFRRPVELIGSELGVTGVQFAKCFEAVNPAPKGTAPTQAREQANKAVLLPCLQAINPSITNDLLDSVSNKYRPNN